MTMSHTRTGFADINGTRIYYEVRGTGHPLVLIHAGIAHSAMWDEQFEFFAKDYRVIRYDVRGFGKSQGTAGEQSHRADLFELLKFLGVEGAYVMGLSMGGSIALDFTLDYPEMVDALILVGSGAGGMQTTAEDQALEQPIEDAFNAKDYARAIELEIQLWVDGPARSPDVVAPAIREQVRQMENENLKVMVEDAKTVRLDPPAMTRLDQVRVPTLIIVGDADVPNIVRLADELTQGIPNARKIVLPDTAHMVNLERPEELNQIVSKFLQSV